MRKLALLALMAAIAAGVVATVAYADHTGWDGTGTANSVTFMTGNPNCAAVPASNSSIKIDPGANYSDAYITVTDYNGKTFKWAFTALGNQIYDMAAVIVKGGPNANIYHYDFAGGGLDSDTRPARAGEPQQPQVLQDQPYPVLLRSQGRR